MKVQWGEVDGVPAIWADAGQVPGPLYAYLTFGTGRSDETMRVAGINHLVEHLALYELGAQPYQWNGEVSPVTTQFYAVGSPQQIVEFFAYVTRRLRDVPVDRLGPEVRVLEIEGQRRGWTPIGHDLSVRLGPRGAGLLGWPEHGLRRVDADEVVQWSHDHFVAENAVLSLSGPIPPTCNCATCRGGSGRRGRRRHRCSQRVAPSLRRGCRPSRCRSCQNSIGTRPQSWSLRDNEPTNASAAPR
jgi:hypothetical protein